MEATRSTQRETAAAPHTPLADALLDLCGKTTFSFHALPLSLGGSIESCLLRDKYWRLYGDVFFKSDITLTGKQFDSFFFPEGVIKEAQALAANLYGADETLFVTTGTTTANHIAAHALYRQGQRVLMDKHCHQSLHFVFQTLQAPVDYLAPINNCEHSGKSHWSLEELAAKVLDTQNDGAPYHLIALNAHSYDGIVYDIPRVIKYLLEHGARTRIFLIDEAWASANYFHKDLRRLAAMNVAALRERYPDLVVVATHSAHKSLSCLRQASMIHLRGPREVLTRLQNARFRVHTTSPSYPILASLDLARAQMEISGDFMVRQAAALAQEFCELIRTDPDLAGYRVNEFVFPEQPFAYVRPDPTKVSLNVAGLAISASVLRELLYERYGLYVNRITENSLLFNFHIGVSRRALAALVEALRDIRLSYAANRAALLRSEHFIIPYPPGVPLVVPGEPVTEQVRKQIRDIQRMGTHIFTV